MSTLHDEEPIYLDSTPPYESGLGEDESPDAMSTSVEFVDLNDDPPSSAAPPAPTTQWDVPPAAPSSSTTESASADSPIHSPKPPSPVLQTALPLGSDSSSEVESAKLAKSSSGSSANSLNANMLRAAVQQAISQALQTSLPVVIGEIQKASYSAREDLQREAEAVLERMKQASAEMTKHYEETIQTVEIAATETVREFSERISPDVAGIKELLDTEGAELRTLLETSNKSLHETGKSVAYAVDIAMKSGTDMAEVAKKQLEPLYEEARRLNLQFDSKIRMWFLAAMLLSSSATVAVLSVLRPGWTLTQQQQEAIFVGEAAIREYRRADEPARAEMRKVMGWKDTEATPLPSTTAR